MWLLVEPLEYLVVNLLKDKSSFGLAYQDIKSVRLQSKQALHNSWELWSGGYRRRIIADGRGFESQYCKLDGSFSQSFVVKL